MLRLGEDFIDLTGTSSPTIPGKGQYRLWLTMALLRAAFGLPFDGARAVGECVRDVAKLASSGRSADFKSNTHLQNARNAVAWRHFELMRLSLESLPLLFVLFIDLAFDETEQDILVAFLVRT